MLGKLARAVFAGLLLAGIVHVVAVLAIPGAAPADAVDRVARVAAPGEMIAIPADGSILLGLDPLFVHAACPFDLADGLLSVGGTMPATPWTVAVVTEPGGIEASLERAAVIDDRLDLVVGRQEDIDRRRVDRAGTDSLVTYAASTVSRGFVLLRAFAEDGDERRTALEQMVAIACGPADRE